MMFEGKAGILYTVLKTVSYGAGFMEYFYFSRNEKKSIILILFLILLANSFFRQFFLFRNRKWKRFGQASIVLEFAIGIYMASLQPVGAAILVLTPAIVESAAAYSQLLGGSISLIALVALILLDLFSQKWIFDYFYFFRSMLVSYGIGFLLVFAISFLASMQFREREMVSRTNQELEQAYQLLLEHASKLQELSEEKERNRMAREIHDTLAHSLTALIVQMEACKRLIDIDVSRAKAEVIKTQELARFGLSELKSAIKALRPQMLVNSSLTDAIHNLILDIKENADVEIVCQQSLSREMDLSSPAEIALFRVIQESITNAIRHGNARRIVIVMAEKDNVLQIDIADDGKGCSHIKEGYGLKGIEERVKGLNGTVKFSSAAGEGFVTNISIPCNFQ